MRVPPLCKLESQIKIGAFLDHTAAILRAQVCHDFIGQRLVALREDDDCECGRVSRSAGLARGTMPPPSRIAKLRDLVFHEKLASCEKLRSCPAEQCPLYGLLEPSTMLSQRSTFLKRVPVFQPLPLTTFPILGCTSCWRLPVQNDSGVCFRRKRICVVPLPS